MKDFAKNVSLIISVFIVIPVGIIYGFSPNFLFDVHLDTTDEYNVFKAITGIYLAFSVVWILGILRAKYWQIAIVSNFIFMFGLAFGRIISVFCDGIPSALFVVGIFGELVLGLHSLRIWKNCTN